MLVVDDEQNMQAVMRMILEGAGYRVLTADSGEAALALAQNPNLDAVLSDLKMPGMGGEQFVVRFRQERPDVPVIVVTAHGTIRSAVKSIHDGAADYLTKPIDWPRMNIVVRRFARQGEARVVLLAEDDPGTRALWRRHLEREGWDVVEAEDGRAALDQVAARAPSLVVLDLMMPRMDGFEFMRELRHWSDNFLFYDLMM